MKMRQVCIGVLLALTCLIVGTAYVKFYNERVQNYYKHLYVLEYECQSGRQLPKIQYNAMTYDGTTTNCTEAQVFTSIPPSVGALHDMWTSSPFYSLMYATDWKIQVAYALFTVVGIVTLITGYFRYRTQQAVLNTFSEDKRSAIDQRKRILVKVSETTPAQDLAKKLLEEDDEEPVFTKRNHSLRPLRVVGTSISSALE